MTFIMILVNFFVDAVMMQLISPAILICIFPFIYRSALYQLLEQVPGAAFWIMAGLILIPGLLARYPAVQRFMALTSGCFPAQGDYKQKIEAAMEPILRRGHLENQEFHYFVQKTDELNAYAIGNDNIVVYSSLLASLSTEELTGILAHEMGHLQNGHTQLRLIFYGMGAVNRFLLRLFNILWNIVCVLQHLPYIGGILAFVMIILRIPIQLGNFILDLPYKLISRFHDRREEKEADLYACSLGFGENLVHGLTRIDTQMTKLNIFQTLFTDHPDTPSRVRYMEDYMNTHGNAVSSTAVPVAAAAKTENDDPGHKYRIQVLAAVGLIAVYGVYGSFLEWQHSPVRPQAPHTSMQRTQTGASSGSEAGRIKNKVESFISGRKKDDSLETIQSVMQQHTMKGSAIATSNGHSKAGSVSLACVQDSHYYLYIIDNKTGKTAYVPFEKSDQPAFQLLMEPKNGQENQDYTVQFEVFFQNDSHDRDQNQGNWSKNGTTHIITILAKYKLQNGTVVPGMLLSTDSGNSNQYLQEQRHVDMVNLLLTELPALKKDMNARNIRM